MSNNSLQLAKKVKNDEFYTKYKDIEAELTAYYNYNPQVFSNKIVLCPCDDPEQSNFVQFFVNNFKKYNLKAFIATSYSPNSEHGKLLVMTSPDTIITQSLKDNGDFRSEEVTKLKEQADIIITNPPFSLFRAFIKWIFASQKQFIVLGNKNAITYRDIFPLIKDNKMWLGITSPKEFITPGSSRATQKVSGLTRWFTNVEHGMRHKPMVLHTMDYNLNHNKILQKKLVQYGVNNCYPHYDNYDAIEVPVTKCIPSDCKGIMGVPITFLDNYDPNQFEIVGNFDNSGLRNKQKYGYVPSKSTPVVIKGKKQMWNGPIVNQHALYKRICIKLK